MHNPLVCVAPISCIGLLAFLLAACGPRYVTRTEWVHVDAAFDNSFIEKVVVVPFSSSARRGSERMLTDRVEAFLRQNTSWTVVSPPGSLGSGRNEVGVVAGIVDGRIAMAIGQVSDANALLVGNVEAFEIERSSSYKCANIWTGPTRPCWTAERRTARVSLQVKVVSAKSGLVVWSKHLAGDYWREGNEGYPDELTESAYFDGAMDDALDGLWDIVGHKEKREFRVQVE